MSTEVNWAVHGPEFEAFVQHHRQRLAMVHFWADWNPLDTDMFQVFEEVHQAVGNDVALARVQVGPPNNVELCRWLGIVQVPTVLFLFRNQIMDVKVGYSKNRLVGHVQMLLHACYAAGPERMPPPMPERLGTRDPGVANRHWPQNVAPSDSAPPSDVSEANYNGFVPSLSAADYGSASPSGALPISAGFGVPYRAGPTEPGPAIGRPSMRFGIYAPQPTAPTIAARQKKSWLSRWLGMD